MMKNLNDFYEEKKKQSFQFMVNTFSKPRYQQPLSKEEQESLQSFMKMIYNPKLKKLKEAEHFREEWVEPEIKATT